MVFISHPQQSARVEAISEHGPGKNGDRRSIEQKKVISRGNVRICGPSLSKYNSRLLVVTVVRP